MENIFPQRLKKLRKAADKTQDEVACALNIKRTTYSEYEGGRITPPIEKVERLAQFFKTTPQYLLGWEEKKQGDSGIDLLLSFYDIAVKLMSGSNVNSSELVATSELIQKIREWNEALDGQALTDEEFHEILNYMKFVLSKRKK